MATFHVTVLLCDACQIEFDGADRLASQVRAVAKEQGWHVNMNGGDFDVCPDCLWRYSRPNRVPTLDLAALQNDGEGSR